MNRCVSLYSHHLYLSEPPDSCKISKLISYPDDPFNRFWEPFTDGNPIVEARSNVSSIDFWNLPPLVAFQRGLTTSRGQKLVVGWPPINLPKTSYYISLYFQDNRTPSLYSWRVFNVSINNQTFYRELNVSTDGAMVYSTLWPLSGKTNITLTPHSDSPVGPIINAGEALMVLPLLGRTLSRDGKLLTDKMHFSSHSPID